MAPSGKLLAAGGYAGVVLFHFNGGSPLTKYKTLLANDNIGPILWDNNNHLYALGRRKGRKTVGLYGHPDQRHGSARLTVLDHECRGAWLFSPSRNLLGESLCPTLAKPGWGCSISTLAPLPHHQLSHSKLPDTQLLDPPPSQSD